MQCSGCKSSFSQHDLIEGFCHACTAKQRDAFRDEYIQELKGQIPESHHHEIDEAIEAIVESIKYAPQRLSR